MSIYYFNKMCIRDRLDTLDNVVSIFQHGTVVSCDVGLTPVSYTHLAGGLVSVTVMLLLILPKKLNLSYTLISVLGSLGHNFGQLLMASVIMKSGFVIYYLPIMAVSGVGMGVATGVLLRVMLPYMNKLQLVKH